MSGVSGTELRVAVGHEIEVIRANWFWFLLLGIGLTVLGIAAIGSAVFATLATVTVLSVLLILGGATHCVGSFWAREWSKFFAHMIGGIFYLVVGVLMFEQPLEAAKGLTLVIAMFLVAGGLLRIVGAVALRFAGWGWLVFSGAITLLLGLMIWRQWPFSGLWVIGTFVGIDMILSGWNWILMSLLLRKSSKRQTRIASN